MNSVDRSWVPNGRAWVKSGLYDERDPGKRWMTKLTLEVKNGIGIGDAGPVEQAQRDYVLVCTSPFVWTLDPLHAKVFQLTIYI